MGSTKWQAGNRTTRLQVTDELHMEWKVLGCLSVLRTAAQGLKGVKSPQLQAVLSESQAWV